MVSGVEHEGGDREEVAADPDSGPKDSERNPRLAREHQKRGAENKQRAHAQQERVLCGGFEGEGEISFLTREVCVLDLHWQR